MVAVTQKSSVDGTEEAKEATDVVYPDSDGLPMADNTKQFRWIVTLKENIDEMLPDFVAGDHLWYPVEGRPTIRIGPDVMVCPGRPKGDRGSYRQWLEGNVPPKVVFEVLSPGNTLREMVRKGGFYAQYGVDEVIFVDPENDNGWARVRGPSGDIDEVETILGWTSPFLGIRFEQVDGELAVFGPDGERFLTWGELAEKGRASERRAAAAAQRAERLAERLRALGVDPESV